MNFFCGGVVDIDIDIDVNDEDDDDVVCATNDLSFDDFNDAASSAQVASIRSWIWGFVFDP